MWELVNSTAEVLTIIFHWFTLHRAFAVNIQKMATFSSLKLKKQGKFLCSPFTYLTVNQSVWKVTLWVPGKSLLVMWYADISWAFWHTETYLYLAQPLILCPVEKKKSHPQDFCQFLGALCSHSHLWLQNAASSGAISIQCHTDSNMKAPSSISTDFQLT